MDSLWKIDFDGLSLRSNIWLIQKELDILNPEFAPPSIIAEEVEVDVDVTELMGNEIFLYLVKGDHNFVARVDPRTRVEMGDKMTVSLNMGNMHIFDPQADPDNPLAVR